MKQLNKKWDRSYIFSFGLILLFLGIFIWLNLTQYVHFISSDSSGDILYAKYLADHSLWISSDWYFTTELRLIYTQMLTAPLFSVLSDWTVIRAIDTTVFCVLLILTYCFMMRGLHIAYKWIWFTAPLLVMPTSMLMMQMVPLVLAYAPYIIITFFYLGLFFRITGNQARAKFQTVILYILFIFFSFYLGLAGMRYLTPAVIPLFLTCLWIAFRSEEFKLLRKDVNLNTWKSFYRSNASKKLAYSIGSLILAGAGYLINDKILSCVFSFQSFSNQQFIDLSTRPVMWVLSFQLGGVLNLFGYNAGKGIVSTGGIANLVSIFVVILIIVFTVKTYKRTRREGNTERQPIVLFFIVTLLFSSFLFLFSGVYADRYYIPAIIFYVPVLAVYFNMKHTKFNFYVAAFLIFASVFTASAYAVKSMAADTTNENRYPAIQYLVQNNYDFGYSTYWNAMVTTEMSKDKIDIAPIKDFNTMVPDRWNVQKEYFQPGYHNGKTFVLLTEDEKSKFADSLYLKDGKLDFDDGNFAVYTFTSSDGLAKAVAAQQ